MQIIIYLDLDSLNIWMNTCICLIHRPWSRTHSQFHTDSKATDDFQYYIINIFRINDFRKLFLIIINVQNTLVVEKPLLYYHKNDAV